MKVEQTKLPSSLKRYFWDIDFDMLDAEKKYRFIATRIFESGDVEAVRWLVAHVSRERLRAVISESRGLSPKSAHFWGLLFGMDETRIACLQKSSQKLQQSHWLK